MNARRPYFRSGIALTLLLAGTASLAGAPAGIAVDERPVQAVFHCLPVWIDSEGGAHPRSVLDRTFQPFCSPAPHLGFRDGDVWFKLKLRNDSDQARARWLEYDNSMVHTVDFFVFDGSGRQIQRERQGYAVPPPEVDFGRNWPMLRLDFAPRSEYTLLIRLRTPFSIRAYLRLLTPAAMRAKIRGRIAIYGVLYGTAFFLLLTVTAAFFVLRQQVFALLAGPIFLDMIFFMSHDGFYFALNGVLPFAHESLPILASGVIPIGTVFAAFFMADLMNIRRANRPRLFALLCGLALVSLLCLMIYPIDFKNGVRIFQINIVLMSVLFAWLLIKAWRNGERHLRFVFLGFLPAFVVSPFMLLGYFGLIPPFRLDIPDMRFPLMFTLFCMALAALDKLAIGRRDYTRQLARDVQAKTAQLNDARRHAEDANKFKESMVRMVAHDLRSPLSGIKTNLPLLHPDTPIKKSDRITVLGEIAETVDGLIGFAQHLLSERHIRESSWYNQPVWRDLNQIAEEAVRQSRSVFRIKGVRLENRVAPVSWHLDPEFMICVLGNILSNAVKFSRPGDFTVLESPAPDTLVIADSGVGMPAPVVAALQQGRRITTPGTEGESGQGLGVQQCFELIEVQNGSLEIESSPGAGTRFVIRWPRGHWRTPKEAHSDSLPA